MKFGIQLVIFVIAVGVTGFANASESAEKQFQDTLKYKQRLQEMQHKRNEWPANNRSKRKKKRKSTKEVLMIIGAVYGCILLPVIIFAFVYYCVRVCTLEMP